MKNRIGIIMAKAIKMILTNSPAKLPTDRLKLGKKSERFSFEDRFFKFVLKPRNRRGSPSGFSGAGLGEVGGMKRKGVVGMTSCIFLPAGGRTWTRTRDLSDVNGTL